MTTKTVETVDRCIIVFDDETYYWLAPGDRDEWLEVTEESFVSAPGHVRETAEMLRRHLDGKDGSYPMRASREWLKRQGVIHGGILFDTCS